MEESTTGSGDILSRIEAAMEEPSDAITTEAQPESQPEESDDTPPEEASAEDKEAQEERADEDEQPEDETTDNIDLSTEDFAELLGVNGDAVTVGEDGSVLIKTKVDGEEADLQLKDLIKSYQTEKHVTLKSKEVSEAKRAFEEQKAEYEQKATAQLNEAANMAQMFENQLLADYGNIDWQTLRATDPAEFAAKRQELSDKQNLLNQAKQQLGAQATQLSEAQKAKNDEAQQNFLAQEAEALLSAIPEWNDTDVASREKEAISKHMIENYGFTEADIAQITDHRAVLVVRDAMRYRQGQVKESVAEKRVKKLPKISKPGRNKQKPNPKSDKAKARRVTLRKTGSVRDAAALLVDRM